MSRVVQAMALNVLGLGMDVHCYGRNPLPDDLAQGATYHDGLASLLPLLDFMSLQCPATLQTRGMMTAEKFAMLPDGAVFVNVARGALVDDSALTAALDSGKLSAPVLIVLLPNLTVIWHWLVMTMCSCSRILAVQPVPHAMRWDFGRMIIVMRFLPENGRATFYGLLPLAG